MKIFEIDGGKITWFPSNFDDDILCQNIASDLWLTNCNFTGLYRGCPGEWRNVTRLLLMRYIMTLEQAILERNISEAEKAIREELKKRPKDIEMWMKLSLTELQYPYHDYETALFCLNRILVMDSSNLNALILEAGIKWHNIGFIDKETFDRLGRIRCLDNKNRAIIHYLMSLYYQEEKDYDRQKIMLKKSIDEYGQYVNPFKDLGKILCSESRYGDGSKMLRKAVENVKLVFRPEDNYDFTDIDLYIAEYITGTALSAANFEYLKSLLKIP